MRRTSALGSALLVGTIMSSHPVLAASHYFDISTPSLPAALALYEKATGIGVITKGESAGNIRVHAIRGTMDDGAALRGLLAGTPLVVDEFNGRNAVIRRKTEPAGKEKAHHAADKVNDIERLFVTGHRGVQNEKRNADVIVDSIAYDPFENLGGNSSIASSLLMIPGVTGINDGDEPRYLSIRGISPDLNQTTIDGMTMASVGESGSGTRQVNLQDTPAEMTSRTDVYKSFTAEQPAEAIGGAINMIPMSAFDHRGLYKYFDGYGIYSTYGGAAGHSGQSGYSPHWGEGAKGTISDTFGKDNQFGFIVSSRYQMRVRNATKNWADIGYYDAKGKSVSAPVAGGYMGPADFSTGRYQNDITTVGGSGALEWRPTGTGIKMSVLGWSYARWERSTMDKTDYYSTGNLMKLSNYEGEIQDNSLYLKRRQDQWNRQNSGVMGDLSWNRGPHALQIRAGDSWETYDNYEPYVQVRTYPNNKSYTNSVSPAYATYSGDPTTGIYTLDSLSRDFQTYAGTKYLVSSATRMWNHSREGIPQVRLDYGYNTAPSAKGFGLKAGFEWRDLMLDTSEQEQVYDTGANLTSYVLDNSYIPWGNRISTPVLNTPFNFPWSSLTQSAANKATSLYDSRVSNFRYQEMITDGYLSLHYKWRNTIFLAGVRVDDANYTSWTPVISNGYASSSFSRTTGSYINPLPSFDVVHHFPHQVNLHVSYSQTVGRPTPGNIAQAENMSCNESDSSQSGDGSECSITRGNPNLKPRKAQNFDIGVDKFFDHNQGMVSLAFFDKWIKDDIYNLRETQSIDNVLYDVYQPMNAERSGIMGVEGSVINRNVRFLRQVFDFSANATWLKGHMTYSNGTQLMNAGFLLNQPTVLVNGAVTWHIPAIRGAVRGTMSYSSRYRTALGTLPYEDSGYGSLVRFNLAFWHQVVPHVTFKYEAINLANQQPVYLQGAHLQYVSEKDNYGRGIYFHVIID